MIETLQELLPWLSSVAFVTKVALSCVVVSLAGFGLAIIWAENRPPVALPETEESATDSMARPPEPEPAVEIPRFDREWSEEGRVARQPLRTGLRHIHTAEDGVSVAEVAPGVWGYVHPEIFNTDLGAKIPVGVPGLDRFPNGPLSFEAHKREDGTIYIIGFVSADAHRRISVDNRIHEPATLYSDYWTGAPQIVQVLLSSASGLSRVVNTDSGGHLAAIDLEPRTEDSTSFAD